MLHVVLVFLRTLRLLTIEHEGIKLQSLMAWCNTLGGAHSALGESMIDHVSWSHDLSLCIFIERTLFTL